MRVSHKFSDPGYLRDEQYRDASKLDQRVSLHERFSTNPQEWHEWVFDQFEFSDSAKILEVGSGPGLLWAQNQTRIGTRWRITLSDFSEGMLKEARGRLRSTPLHSFVCLDVQDVPFTAGHFDAVIANHMLYHVPDVERALSAVAGLLRPNGTLYATTNGEANLQELAELVQRAAGDRSPERGDEFQDSVRNFSLQSGYEKLKRFFAKVEIARYADSLHVTEPGGIVRFVRSSSVFRLSDEGVARLRNLVSRRIRANGAVDVRKEVGMFIARSPREAEQAAGGPQA